MVLQTESLQINEITVFLVIGAQGAVEFGMNNLFLAPPIQEYLNKYKLYINFNKTFHTSIQWKTFKASF